MPITEDAKELLRERLKIARQAKADKKNKIAEAINKSTNVEKPVAQAEPVVVNKQPAPKVATEQVVAQAEPVSQVSSKVEVEKPTDSATTLPKAKKVSKPSEYVEKSPKVVKQKNKYAKLVFYQEPTNKKMKKLTKIMDNSSSDTDDDFNYKAPVSQETSSQQLHYNKLSQLSRMIFD